MKDGKRKKVDGQIFEKAANLGFNIWSLSTSLFDSGTNCSSAGGQWPNSGEWLGSAVGPGAGPSSMLGKN